MTARLTYSAEYPGIHESNWSLVNKILRFNHIDFSDFRTLIIKNKRGRFRSFYQYTDSNVDFSLLRRKFGLGLESTDIDIFNLKYLPCFKSLNINLKKNNIDKLIFCPECIKYGFHTPFFMSPLFSHCPIHSCKLFESCPCCNKEIPNILSVDALANPYGCPNCGYDLYKYKNSFSRLDITEIDKYIERLCLASNKTESWNWVFNFHREVRVSTNDISSIIVNLLNEKKCDSSYPSWNYKDTDPVDGKYYKITKGLWEEMPNILHIGLKESLISTLVDAFCLYMESKEFKDLTKEIDHEKKIKLIGSWEQVWSQRVSRYREFGRFCLLEAFISNKIIDCDLYKIKGMFLMRDFEILLVNVLYFQLHLTFLTAIRSNKEGFDLRCEIEAAIESCQFISNKKDKSFYFYALTSSEITFDNNDISFIKSMINKSISQSNIYKFCRA